MATKTTAKVKRNKSMTKQKKPLNESALDLVSDKSHKIPEVLRLAFALDYLNQRIEGGRVLVRSEHNQRVCNQLCLAVEHYQHQKIKLLEDSKLSFDEIVDAIMKITGSADLNPIKDDRIAGIKLIERSIEGGYLDRSGDNKFWRGPASWFADCAPLASIDKLGVLVQEYLRVRKGVVACPRCTSHNTQYKEYSVVLKSPCLICNNCRYPWRLPEIINK